jgi:tryptophan synthase alpha chain
MAPRQEKSPIAAAFAQARAEHRVALIPYVMAGYPDSHTSEMLAVELCRAGATVLELGIPFSDPLADGATIQRASQKALESGMSLTGALTLAGHITPQISAPLVMMSYYNPIFNLGLEEFCKQAAAANVSGVIVPDLPPEEAQPFVAAGNAYGIEVIFLVTPTSPDARIEQIAGAAAETGGGFLYCVSLSGVTGARDRLPEHLAEFLARVRSHTDLPLAVGFGVARPEHIAEIGRIADGAVVASALLNVVDSVPAAERIPAAVAFLQSLREGAQMQ